MIYDVNPSNVDLNGPTNGNYLPGAPLGPAWSTIDYTPDSTFVLEGITASNSSFIWDNYSHIWLCGAVIRFTYIGA